MAKRSGLNATVQHRIFPHSFSVRNVLQSSGLLVLRSDSRWLLVNGGRGGDCCNRHFRCLERSLRCNPHNHPSQGTRREPPTRGDVQHGYLARGGMGRPCASCSRCVECRIYRQALMLRRMQSVSQILECRVLAARSSEWSLFFQF
ncbi:hypothetical protein J6590_090090 [Homalodisca vitripennis]|nr:hypothetical protein J6590_090090 [Homalodisca vitripennis]